MTDDAATSTVGEDSPWADPNDRQNNPLAAAGADDVVVSDDPLLLEDETTSSVLIERPQLSPAAWKRSTAMSSAGLGAVGLFAGYFGVDTVLNLNGWQAGIESSGDVAYRVVWGGWALLLAAALLFVSVRLWRQGVYLYNDRGEVKYLFRTKSIDRDRVRHAEVNQRSKWNRVRVVTEVGSMNWELRGALNSKEEARHIATRINRWCQEVDD